MENNSPIVPVSTATVSLASKSWFTVPVSPCSITDHYGQWFPPYVKVRYSQCWQQKNYFKKFLHVHGALSSIGWWKSGQSSPVEPHLKLGVNRWSISVSIIYIIDLPGINTVCVFFLILPALWFDLNLQISLVGLADLSASQVICKRSFSHLLFKRQICTIILSFRTVCKTLAPWWICLYLDSEG